MPVSSLRYNHNKFSFLNKIFLWVYFRAFIWWKQLKVIPLFYLVYLIFCDHSITQDTCVNHYFIPNLLRYAISRYDKSITLYYPWYQYEILSWRSSLRFILLFNWVYFPHIQRHVFNDAASDCVFHSQNIVLLKTVYKHLYILILKIT